MACVVEGGSICSFAVIFKPHANSGSKSLRIGCLLSDSLDTCRLYEFADFDGIEY